MSYGVWRKHGKGWSSIEIDSPWNYNFNTLEYLDEKKALTLKQKTKASWDDNPHYAQWEYNQERKGRMIDNLCTGGEHTLTIAYDDMESKRLALKKLAGSFISE